jgi:hypothetical protein
MLSFTLTFGWGNRALDIVEFEKADHLSGNLGSGFAVASERRVSSKPVARMASFCSGNQSQNGQRRTMEPIPNAGL